jgi:hypothetical protein
MEYDKEVDIAANNDEYAVGDCYLLKVICASVVSVRASPNTVASWA